MISTIQAQQNEIEKLKKLVEAMQNQLKSRELKLENAGSLAEASAIVNNLFATAQATADTYLENIKRLELRSQEVISEMESKADGIIAEAENVAQKRIATADAEVARKETEGNEIIAEAENAAQKRITEAEAEATRKEIEGREIVAEAERKAQKILNDTELEVNEKWKVIEQRLLSMYESHQGLREMVESGIFSFPKG